MLARGPRLKHRALIAILAVLAFACGGLAVGWKRDHDALSCWRDMGEMGLTAEGACDR